MEPQFEVTYTDREGTRLQIFSETLETIVKYTAIHSWRDVEIVSRFNRDMRYSIVDGELIPADRARKWLSPNTCPPWPPAR